MSVGVVVGVAIGLLLLVLVARARRYGRQFSDEHWREVAQGMLRVKAAALARVIRAEDDQAPSREDPRLLTTSAGLAIFYTVSERDSRFVHHCSVSVVGGLTTHAVGGTFLLFVAKLLRLPLAELRCEVAASSVHHAELSLDADRHAALAATPVLDVSSMDLSALRSEALDSRALVDWQTPLDAEQAGAS